MERRHCLKSLVALGVCSGVVPALGMNINPPPVDEQYKRIVQEKEFIMNWVHDLLDTMDRELDEATRVKLIEGCGRGCYNRFDFKKDIARQGEGDIDKLVEAYKQNFEVWKEDNLVHVRYGERSERCYCPAAQIREPQPNDIHCECTRTTHQSIFEAALGHPVKVEIVESLRRGGKTCHFKATV